MKTIAWALLLLVGLGLPVAGQEVEIVGCDATGSLTWTATPPPLYCGVETKWAWSHTWLPVLEWNRYVTNTVTSTTADLAAVWEQLAWLLRLLTGEAQQALFFRVVASTTPLAPPCATNAVRVINASTSELVNVETGLIENGSRLPLTNVALLAPGATSPVVAVVQDIPLPVAGVITNRLVPMMPPVEEGWYVSYAHEASNRLVESIVVPFGVPEKPVAVTVSNHSVTVTFEWFGFAGTIAY